MDHASQLAHQLRDLMVGLPYGGSWNKRTEKNFLGIHDCWGNTFTVNGAVNDAAVDIVDAMNLRCHIFYSGTYRRSNYVSPCVHHHDENLSPSGELFFSLQVRLLQAPVIKWEESRNLSPFGHDGHDSNAFTLQALKDAIEVRLHS